MSEQKETIKEIIEVLLYEQSCNDCKYYTTDPNGMQTYNDTCNTCTRPSWSNCKYEMADKSIDYAVERIKLAME